MAGRSALVYPAAGVADRLKDLPSPSGGESGALEAVIQDLREAMRAPGSVDKPALETAGLAGQRAHLGGEQALSRELAEVVNSLQRVDWCLQTLRHRQPLREFTFPRRVPVVGRLVAVLQEQVGRVSARWYSRYLLLQQNEINTLLWVSIDNLTASVQQLTRVIATMQTNSSTTPHGTSTSHAPQTFNTDQRPAE